VFLSCEVGLFSKVSLTHVIKLRIFDPLINPPSRLLTVNVCDAICIWARYRDTINPLRRGDRTIIRSIGLT
jgi:hypothetical protein